jgi:riboflavin kinase/FMN adenylyltransferase
VDVVRSNQGPTVLTIGTFDGVHIGHQALVRRARAIADGRPGARVVALVFDPNPLAVLRPEAAPQPLSSFEQRSTWLRDAGADEVVRLEPTHELLSESPEAFIDRLVSKLGPIAFVEGDDFRFGKARAGTNAVLAELGKPRGFFVEVVPPVTVPLSDHQIAPARSTMVRWLLSAGRARDAAIILGRPYELNGTVVQGDRRGRTIGFPTANVQVSTMIPADGVYAAAAMLPDGRELPAALSIGTKPTFGGADRAVEAFLLDPVRRGGRWSPIDGLPEYGWTLRLRLLAWVREQVQFHSLDALLEQMERDCDRCEEIVRCTTGADAVCSGSMEARPASPEGTIA